MRVNEGAQAAVVSALRHAAARTGTDFGFLMAQARAESSLRPDAQAATSSARGLFQFTRSTWLDVVQRHGSNHAALGWAADVIKSGAAQAGTVVRDAVLALRDDPEAASLMAGELARDNKASLETRLGRPVGAAEVHMAHVLGAGGAASFLRALASTPHAPAASIVPKAAAANRSIFYTASGAPRSLDAVMQIMASKIAAPDTVVPQAPAPQAPAPQTTAPQITPPERTLQARAAYLLLAELGG